MKSTNTEGDIFRRTELLLGKSSMERMASARVIIFGVGGVGSWCAESLIRSGIGHVTLVDFDEVCATNINRQLMATTLTVGQAKVEVLKTRLLEINPRAEVDALRQIYNEETAASFRLDDYHYIIDAIDSLSCKAHLIREACKTKTVLYSSMGAALKIDPSRIRVAEFWRVNGCPLAAALRKKFRKEHKPTRKFKCVFSDELLPNQEAGSLCNGTLAHATAIFGFTLAGLVVQDIRKKHNKEQN